MEPVALEKDAIILAYRLLLGREPENNKVIEKKQKKFKTIQELCKAMVSSEEFLSRFNSIENNEKGFRQDFADKKVSFLQNQSFCQW